MGAGGGLNPWQTGGRLDPFGSTSSDAWARCGGLLDLPTRYAVLRRAVLYCAAHTPVLHVTHHTRSPMRACRRVQEQTDNPGLGSRGRPLYGRGGEPGACLAMLFGLACSCCVTRGPLECLLCVCLCLSQALHTHTHTCAQAGAGHPVRRSSGTPSGPVTPTTRLTSARAGQTLVGPSGTPPAGGAGMRRRGRMGAATAAAGGAAGGGAAGAGAAVMASGASRCKGSHAQSGSGELGVVWAAARCPTQVECTASLAELTPGLLECCCTLCVDHTGQAMCGHWLRQHAQRCVATQLS
jgi:hypothetical protein